MHVIVFYMKKTRIITRSVWILSLVSLFNDISSEMLYPVWPVYLNSIGFSVILIGILEGLAEATAGFSKGYFGQLSDIKGKRLPFVQLGYLLTAVSKPLMALFTFPVWVFGARTTDRLGKGIRTAARDALLSEESTLKTRGRIFGLHRGMDTLGAAIGPMVALAFLYFHPQAYRTLFFLAFLPGLCAVICTLMIREKKKERTPAADKTYFLSFLKYIPGSDRNYRKLLAGLLAFALVNSSDVFLLLMLKYRGLSDTELIGAYIFYNLVYALFSYPAGKLADHFGFKALFIAGLVIFSIIYLEMAFNTSMEGFYILFFLYGIYAASTEGVAKAWISTVCSPKDTATAIGTYEGLRSLTTLAASSIAGMIWFLISPSALFIFTAVAVAGIVLYFFSLSSPVKKQ